MEAPSFTRIDRHILSENTPGIDSFRNRKTEMVEHLQHRALEDQKNGIGVTYVWVLDEKEIVGYVSLAMFSMRKSLLPKKDRNVGYRDIPVMLLGQIATHQDYEGRGIGEFMVLWTAGMARRYSRGVGCRGIVLHPHDDVIDWYVNKLNFCHLKDNEKDLMYLDVFSTR